MNKRKLAISTVGTVLIIGMIGAITALNQPKPTGADTSPVTTQLQQQQDELNNHESRITNNENAVKALSSNTGTTTTVTQGQPSNGTSSQQPTTPQPNPTPPPLVVTAFQEIVLDPANSDCLYTYSDGTSNQFHWKTTNPQGSWQTDGNGQNGHWVATTQTSGYCDQHAIGSAKS